VEGGRPRPPLDYSTERFGKIRQLFARFCLELRGTRNRSYSQIKENHRDGAASRWNT